MCCIVSVMCSLIVAAINAENAVHKSEKFTAMAIRTRQEYLKDLATNFVTTSSLDSGSKFGKNMMLCVILL